MNKIIFFSRNLCIGGMEKALVTLLNQIDTKTNEVTLVLEKEEGELCKEVSDNVKLINYNLSKNPNVLLRKATNLFKKIIFTIKNYHKYDCAISYATYSIFSSQMARKCSKNSVIFIHSDYYNLYNGKEKEIKAFFNEIKANEFNRIVFVSKQSKDNIIKIMPELSDKSVILGNLIDYKNIQREAKDYNPKMNEEKINIAFVGRLDEHSKNLSKLIEKVNDNAETEKYDLYIIGTGPDEARYKKLKKASNIIFVGETRNPYPYIKKSDYLILTSKYEGFPVVYNEATVLGTKIITTILVEDEQIHYDDKNVIKLKKDLSNFDQIISTVSKKKNDSQEIDFEKINQNKIEEFYKIVQNR